MGVCVFFQELKNTGHCLITVGTTNFDDLLCVILSEPKRFSQILAKKLQVKTLTIQFGGTSKLKQEDFKELKDCLNKVRN